MLNNSPFTESYLDQYYNDMMNWEKNTVRTNVLTLKTLFIYIRTMVPQVEIPLGVRISLGCHL